MKGIIFFLIFIKITILLLSCGEVLEKDKFDSVSNKSTGIEKPDYWPTVSWRTSEPEKQGLDPRLRINNNPVFSPALLAIPAASTADVLLEQDYDTIFPALTALI